MRAHNKNLFMPLIVIVACLGIMSCTGVPEGASPVNNFEKQRYLGTWYEIARLDHRFERGLSQVTAEYSLREDGGIKVINKGYNAEKGEWKTAEGKAFFVDSPAVGHLKVSFFGPFYASYVILELDKENYQYALVSGPDTDYLWILSRQPTIDPDVQEKLLQSAKQLGFDTDSLIYVEHDKNENNKKT